MATPLLPPETLARFAVTARLGAALSRPFTLLDPGGWDLGPLSPPAVEALRRSPLFAAPLERALRDLKGIGASVALSPEAVEAAAGTPEGRLGVLLVAEPLQTVERAALRCAAAAMQRQILGLMRKDERQRIRALIGADNVLIATQEAPTLHAALAALGSDVYFRDALAAPDEAAARRFTDYGMKLLEEFVGATQPALGPLLSQRLSPEARAVRTGGAMAAHARQFVRFVRRRMPEWSAIIG